MLPSLSALYSAHSGCKLSVSLSLLSQPALHSFYTGWEKEKGRDRGFRGLPSGVHTTHTYTHRHTHRLSQLPCCFICFIHTACNIAWLTQQGGRKKRQCSNFSLNVPHKRKCNNDVCQSTTRRLKWQQQLDYTRIAKWDKLMCFITEVAFISIQYV